MKVHLRCYWVNTVYLELCCIKSHLFQLLDKYEQSQELHLHLDLNWASLYLRRWGVCMWLGLWPICAPTVFSFFHYTSIYSGSHCGHPLYCTFSCIELLLQDHLRLLLRFFWGTEQRSTSAAGKTEPVRFLAVLHKELMTLEMGKEEPTCSLEHTAAIIILNGL